MHWRGVQKISITLAKLVEFLVISIFYETKIRTVDMKAHVYSKFSKKKISKKKKSPNSMRNGRFDTSKWREKLEKMGVLCTHSPKSPGPFSKLPIKNWPKCRRKHKKNSKIQKKKGQADPVQVLTRGRPATSGCPPAAGRHLDRVGLPLFFWIFFLWFPPFFAQVVNSCWLVLAHARPAQSSPKTSNSHNFWTVAPEIMKFALTRSLFWDASSQKFQKI
jgi:hypothetical protein